MTNYKDNSGIQQAIRSLQTRAEKLQPITTTTPVTGGTVQQIGWLCPACGGGNAPFVQRCPCKGWPKMEITC